MVAVRIDGRRCPMVAVRIAGRRYPALVMRIAGRHCPMVAVRITGRRHPMVAVRITGRRHLTVTVRVAGRRYSMRAARTGAGRTPTAVEAYEAVHVEAVHVVDDYDHHGWTDRRVLGVIGLAALSVVTCLAGLRAGPALGDHESINALAAREAIQSGRWLIPHLGDAPRIRKTPLGIWLIGASSFATGHPAGAPPVTRLSARLPSAVAALANIFVVFWLGLMLYGYRGGLTAGFICAGSVATMLYARNAQVDMVLTLFTSLAFACFWRGAMHPQPHKAFMMAFYVAFALAMLAKAPLPLATIGLSLAVYWFVTVPVLSAAGQDDRRLRTFARQWGRALGGQVARLRMLWIVPGLILFLVVVGAWPAYVYGHVDNALALWRIEYVDRFTGELSDRVRPAWYYVPIVLGLMFPFVASVPEAVASPFLARYAARRRGLAYAFTWAVVVTVFLSTAAFKRPHYLLSSVPAYCLLLAPVIERLFFGAVSAGARTVRAVCCAAPVLLAVGAVVGGIVLQHRYPVLLRPYIVAVCGAFAAWAGACLCYARHRRVSAFVLLNLGAPVLMLVMWPAVGTGIAFNAEAGALAAALRRAGVGVKDDIVWADKRPNASIEFYTGLRIGRLIDENEMAGLRRGRRTVSGGVYEAISRRIAERLRAEHPVFVILRAKHYRMLASLNDPPPRVLFQLDGFHEHAGDELVVVTQAERAYQGRAMPPDETPDATVAPARRIKG